MSRRFWFWGPRSTWNEFKVFRGGDEYCNPTICFYSPFGALIVVTSRRVRSEPCVEHSPE